MAGRGLIGSAHTCPTQERQMDNAQTELAQRRKEVDDLISHEREEADCQLAEARAEIARLMALLAEATEL
jgi:hypothetical protein